MAAETPTALAVGETAPPFDLPATDGRRYSLDSFANNPLLGIVFLANHCPYVGAWEDRLIAIAQEYAGRGVAFAAISSNDATKFTQDTFEKMAARATDRGYPFPYLYDEAQDAARAYGATRTPEVFLFDSTRRLRYHGAIDSDWEEEDPNREEHLRDALDALLQGGEVHTAETQPVGCSLKLRP